MRIWAAVVASLTWLRLTVIVGIKQFLRDSVGEPRLAPTDFVTGDIAGRHISVWQGRLTESPLQYSFVDSLTLYGAHGKALHQAVKEEVVCQADRAWQ